MEKLKKENNREKILLAVEELIVVDGVNSFSLKDISNKTSLSLGTIYYYYRSKSDLIFDLLERHMNSLKKDFEEWIIRHKDDSVTLKRFLEVIIYKGVVLYNKSKIRLYLINECLASNHLLKERYLTLYNEWKEEIIKGLDIVSPLIKNKNDLGNLIMLIVDGLTINESLANIDQNIVDILLKFLEE